MYSWDRVFLRYDRFSWAATINLYSETVNCLFYFFLHILLQKRIKFCNGSVVSNLFHWSYTYHFIAINVWKRVNNKLDSRVSSVLLFILNGNPQFPFSQYALPVRIFSHCIIQNEASRIERELAYESRREHLLHGTRPLRYIYQVLQDK